METKLLSLRRRVRVKKKEKELGRKNYDKVPSMVPVIRDACSKLPVSHLG